MDLDGVREMIIGFVLVSLIAAAGALAMTGFQSDTKEGHITTPVKNETVTISNLAATLSQANNFYRLIACYNETNNAATINVHCNATNGIMSFSAEIFSGTVANVTYSYYTSNEIMNITNSGLSGIDNTTG